MHIGIDNGLNGGIVALSDILGLPPIAKIPTPTYERKRKAKGKNKKPRYERELDIDALLQFLHCDCCAKDDPTTIFHVEQAPRHAPGADSLRVMSFTYGMIIAMLKCMFPLAKVIRVRCGNDNDGWQKRVLPGVKPKETKAAALAKVKEIWPEETWLASERCSTPHDGMIDGALIAYDGIIQWGKRPGATLSAVGITAPGTILKISAT